MTKQAAPANDAELVGRTRAGHLAAFDALVNRYYGLVYAIALARLNHRESAEELTQEAFLRAYMLLDRLESPPRFSAWVGQIARNVDTGGKLRVCDDSANRVRIFLPDGTQAPFSPVQQGLKQNNGKRLARAGSQGLTARGREA